MAKVKEVFAFGYQREPDGKYKIKLCFDKKKAFNTFYKNKSKHFKCGVFLCRALNDYDLIKYAEYGIEIDPEKAEKENNLCLQLQ